jgi:hypothetical protein
MKIIPSAEKLNVSPVVVTVVGRKGETICGE